LAASGLEPGASSVTVFVEMACNGMFGPGRFASLFDVLEIVCLVLIVY
jgi:hypothetical protein